MVSTSLWLAMDLIIVIFCLTFPWSNYLKINILNTKYFPVSHSNDQIRESRQTRIVILQLDVLDTCYSLAALIFMITSSKLMNKYKNFRITDK